jgi:hypothetical protein
MRRNRQDEPGAHGKHREQHLVRANH